MIEEKKEHLDKLEAELKTLRASERAIGAKRKNFEEMVVQQLGIEANIGAVKSSNREARRPDSFADSDVHKRRSRPVATPARGHTTTPTPFSFGTQPSKPSAVQDEQAGSAKSLVPIVPRSPHAEPAPATRSLGDSAIKTSVPDTGFSTSSVPSSSAPVFGTPSFAAPAAEASTAIIPGSSGSLSSAHASTVPGAGALNVAGSESSGHAAAATSLAAMSRSFTMPDCDDDGEQYGNDEVYTPNPIYELEATDMSQDIVDPDSLA